MADLYISTTHEGMKHSSGECLSISHVLTGGVLIDTVPTRYWQLMCQTLISRHKHPGVSI